MRKAIVATLAILILAGFIRPQSAGSQDPAQDKPIGDLAARIDALLAKTYPPDKPGAVGLVIRNGETILRKGYGLADLEQSVPMTPEAVFACGSMTKMFTAAAVMLLAEAGKLRYEDPISTFFPDAPAAWTGITIDHLLSHTSGILDLFRIPAWMAQWKEEITPQALIAFFKDKPLQFEPGAKPDYCNSNYALLGQIVEKVSGQSLDDFATSRIIEPLGLHKTRYAVGHAEIIPRRAKLYLLERDGSFKNPPYLVPWSQAYGAGTVHSTVDDIAKFVAALLDGRLLKPESRDKVTTPRLMKDGKPSPFGYGSLFIFAEGNAPMVRVSGSTMGTQVYSLYLKEANAFVAVFSNVSTHQPNTPNPYFPGSVARDIAGWLAEK